MSLKFPPGCLTEAFVRASFAPMEQNNGPAFLTNLSSNDVSWTAMGVSNPLRGHYTTKNDIASQVFGKIMPKMDPRYPISAKVVNVIVSGEWATVELRGSGRSREGTEYEHELCWICRFAEGVIVEARVYMDSALLEKVLAE